MLQNIDAQVFIFINQTLTHPWADAFFSTFTNVHKVWWVQVFIVPPILVLWWRKCRWQLPRVLLAIGIAAGVTDLFSHRVIKNISFRPRPWMVKELEPQRRVPYGPRSSSFPSNHAANSAAMAAVFIAFYPAWWPFFVGYVALTGYSRVYVGVHYLSDVFSGWALGALIGYLLVKFVFRRWSFFGLGLRHHHASKMSPNVAG